MAAEKGWTSVTPAERAVVLIGRILGRIADLIPGSYDGALEVPAVPKRMVRQLDVDCRDTQWVTPQGVRWRWAGGMWEYRLDDGVWRSVPSYYVPHSGASFTEVPPDRL
jgi:hypothetical protein